MLREPSGGGMGLGDAKGGLGPEERDTSTGTEARAEFPVAPHGCPPKRQGHPPAQCVLSPTPLCHVPPSQAVINTMCGQGMQAMSYLEASAFIYTNGCIDKLVNWIHSNLFLLGGIALGLAVPQVPGWRGTGGMKRPSCSSALLSVSFGSRFNNVSSCNSRGVGAGFGVWGEWCKCRACPCLELCNLLVGQRGDAAWHPSSSSSPAAGGHLAGSDPHQPDQRPDQTAALQPAAPGRPLVLTLGALQWNRHPSLQCSGGLGSRDLNGDFPNPGSVRRAEGPLLEKREVGHCAAERDAWARWGVRGFGSRRKSGCRLCRDVPCCCALFGD